MKTAEILYFIREAVEEKQNNENNLTLKEYREVETLLDYVEEIVNFAMKHKDDKY